MQASVLLLRRGSYRWAPNLWVLIIYLFFLPVMLPSVVPRLATDSAVRVFPGVWKPLSFLRLPSQDRAPSLPLLSLYLLYFFLPPFEDNGLLFWVPDVLYWHSEVVLWNFPRVQMFFWWMYGGESGLPVLFLRHFCKNFFKVSLWCFTLFVSFIFSFILFFLFYQDAKFSGCQIRCLILVGISFLKIILKYILLKS